MNLAVNAMDAMADMPVVARKIVISTTRIDNFAEATISDGGPGFASDKIKEVFEPFFTTKQSGMGMGLSIARTIVEAHDGDMGGKPALWRRLHPDQVTACCVAGAQTEPARASQAIGLHRE
jgi:C4-dicarboxylate-specific signal transduction histidine kinase